MQSGSDSANASQSNFMAMTKKKLASTLAELPLKMNYNYDDLVGRSFCLLGSGNCFRRLCYRITKFRFFEPFILFMIIFSTILLTLETPLDDPNSEKLSVLEDIDVAVTIIFTIECVVKIISVGFLCNGKDSYLRSSWNIMDFVIVVFSVISLAAQGIQVKFIRVLRMLRVLRPLRVISRNEGLKIAVQSLIASIPEIGNVIIISLLFLMLFGILATTYFKGALFHCLTDNMSYADS